MTRSAEEISKLRDAWKDFQVRQNAESKRFSSSKPRKVGNVLAQLVSLRGYAQVRVSDELEKAWHTLVGPQLAEVTQFSKMRRGTMEILVANSLLIQELTFRKQQLLEELQSVLPDHKIRQLRFCVGKSTDFSDRC